MSLKWPYKLNLTIKTINVFTSSYIESFETREKTQIFSKLNCTLDDRRQDLIVNNIYYDFCVSPIKSSLIFVFVCILSFSMELK